MRYAFILVATTKITILKPIFRYYDQKQNHMKKDWTKKYSHILYATRIYLKILPNTDKYW